MTASERLLNFFRSEVDLESQSFHRLSRIPDSRLAAQLAYYRTLADDEQAAFRDCCAHWAHACYAFVVGVAPLDHTQHPFFRKWQRGHVGFMQARRSVPTLRTLVQQYKIDMHRNGVSLVSDEDFAFASSTRSVKAPELRRRVKKVLSSLGFYRIDDLGYYRCSQGQEFLVAIDFGRRNAQLRYCVIWPEFQPDPLNAFCFEKALGFGFGDWDFIVEENVDVVFKLLGEVVTYSMALPHRIRQNAG